MACCRRFIYVPQNTLEVIQINALHSMSDGLIMQMNVWMIFI